MSASVISGILDRRNTTAREKTKTGNGEIDPLHILQGALVVKGEEDVGSEDRGNDSPRYR